MKSTLLVLIGLLFLSLSYPQSITVNCSGDVGIGCTPGYDFDVLGDSRFQSKVGIGCIPTIYQFDVLGNSRFQSKVGIGCTPTTYQFDVSGTSRLLGSVGINCVPSAYKLDVSGTSRLQGDVSIIGKVLMAGSGGSPDPNYRLKVMQGNTFINGNLDLGSSGTPGPFIKINTSLLLTAILQDYPDINVGSLGTSSDKWGDIYCEDIYADEVHEGSDLRIKENIRDIDNSLEKIMSLRPVNFDFKPIPVPDIPEWKEYVIDKNLRRKNKAGFIAQEVLNVIPDIVEYDTAGDKYYIDYNAIIPYLVEAIQEQQLMIESLESEINDLKSGSGDNLKSGLITGAENNGEQAVVPILFQNEPNPFNEDTRIKFYIPESINQAILYIYNMQGEQIRSRLLSQRRSGAEIIHGYDLQPGMYLYTLIVDGKEVDTKRMILTD